MRRMTLIAGVATLGVALATYGTLDAYDHVPGVLTIDPDPSAAPQPAPVATSGTPVPRVPVPAPATRSTAAEAPVPSTAGLQQALGPALADRRLGGDVSLVVRDGTTGAHLLDVAADTPRTPASTAKLLTAAAVLPALGPDTRLRTSTVLAPDGSVVLVAGGDMLLGRGDSRPGAVEGHAGVRTLARQTARALSAAGRTSVRLRLDTTRAAGPDYAPTWPREFLGQAIVGKVGTLGLADGLVDVGEPGPADPAGEVASVLRDELVAAGVTVTGDTARGAAPAGAAPLASVESAPVADVLGVALDRSDNALTESLARQAAVAAGAAPARGPVTFEQVARWVHGSLVAQGYDLRGVRLVDSCGLSRGTTVPARVVADVLARGTTGKDPALARVVGDLPVAGLTGTLSTRYVEGAATGGAGLVRAKTGTLTGVGSLGGTVVDRDGRTLAFALIANGVPADGTLAAREAMDALTTRLAACGCR